MSRPGHHHDAAGARLDQPPHSGEELLHPPVARGVLPARLMSAEAGEHGNDAEWPRAEHMLEEDDLELERVLSLVIELVGVGVKAFGCAGESVDARRVGGDGPQRCVERFAAKGERLAHGRVRGAEEDERVSLGRERRSERAVRMPVPHRPAPRVDVGRDETHHRTANARHRGRARAIGPGQAGCVDVAGQCAGLAVVSAAGVRRRAHRGIGEVALDLRPRLTEASPLEEEARVELVGQAHDDVDGHVGAELNGSRARDLLARGLPREAGDNRAQNRRDDRMRGRHPLRVAQEEDSAVFAVRNDDGLEGAQGRTIGREHAPSH